MNKLSSAARTTEIDVFSDAIVAIFDSDKKVCDDAFLQKTFSQIKKLSDDITESVKRTKAKATYKRNGKSGKRDLGKN